MSLLREYWIIVCLFLFLCMASTAGYLLYAMFFRARRHFAYTSKAPVIGAFVVFVLSFAACLFILFAVNPKPPEESAEGAFSSPAPSGAVSSEPVASARPEPSFNTRSDSGDAVSFDAGARQLTLEVAAGKTDYESARELLEKLAQSYLTPSHSERWQAAALLLETAQKPARYLEALQNSEFETVDKLLRFYWEDYLVYSLAYPNVPEYRLFTLVSEDKAFANDAVSAALISGQINAYIDYSLAQPATKTRLEMLSNLDSLLRDLGFAHARAGEVSLAANRAMRVIRDGGFPDSAH